MLTTTYACSNTPRACAQGSALALLALFILLVGTVPHAAHAQSQITAVVTSSQAVTFSSYTVNGKTVNHGQPTPGNDLRLEQFTANSFTFVPEAEADNIVIRRYDPPTGGPPGTPFGDAHTLYYWGTFSGGVANIETERVLSEEEALFSQALNRGSDNTFDNNRGAVDSNNIERIDFMFNAGRSVDASNLGLSGFPVFERNGGNTFGMAAITSVDLSGDPSGYGPLVVVSNNTGPLVVPNGSYVSFRQPDGATLLEPISQGSPQGIKGVFVSLQDLGLSGGQTFYGYSLFGEDVTASHDLVDYESFPKTETGGADLVGGGAFFRENTITLPVELTAFEVRVDGQDAHLAWKTASETNNAGFEVQQLHLQTGTSWQALGWVEGRGTTLEAQSYTYRLADLAPGPYTFRLKQIDYDGTFDYSPTVEVFVEMAERFRFDPVYPNPFNPEARFDFAVSLPQEVVVSLYDVLGRQVQVLYTGTPAAGQMQTVQIDGSRFPSGLYMVRIVGETFNETQRVTLIR